MPGWGERAARNVQAASGGIGMDVIPAAFSAHLRALEHFIRTGFLRGCGRRQSSQRDCEYENEFWHLSLS